MKSNLKTITVRVTKRHISTGVKGDCYDCPVALATGEAIQSLASFDGDSVWGVGFDCIFAPRSARRFAERFDDGRKVKPFSFKLKFPHGV